MSTVKIKKAKIKDELFLEVEYTEDMPGHTKKDTKLSCTIPVHVDLKESFKKLHTHLAILCDEAKEPKKKDFDTSEFFGFNVRGFSIGGSDDNEGVTISGFKEGKYGTVNLNTPFKKWSDEEYPFISELSLSMTDAIEEVEQYLFNGKRAPEAQLELEFPEEDNSENYVTNA